MDGGIWHAYACPHGRQRVPPSEYIDSYMSQIRMSVSVNTTYFKLVIGPHYLRAENLTANVSAE